MKILVLICFLFSTCIFNESSRARMDSRAQINFNEIKEEIEWFIDKVKPESVGHGKYNVYVAKIYEDENRYCTTIGIIQDSLSMSYANGFKYYIQISEDLVLLDYSDEFKRKHEFDSKDIYPLIDKQIVGRKIYNRCSRE